MKAKDGVSLRETIVSFEIVGRGLRTAVEMKDELILDTSARKKNSTQEKKRA